MANKMQPPPPPPCTQVRSKSNTVYHWVILFKCNVDEENPFFCAPLSYFDGSNFPFTVSSMQLKCFKNSITFN